ncbi:MAG: hypothetical protein KY438_10710 [Actinobacteria bacterium]|nr:hypothetical protein [Actinomycetota bacterium]
MLNLHCRTCDQAFVAGPASFASLHHTTDGLIGYARCPTGHVNVVNFHARVHPVEAEASRVTAA